MAAERRKQFTFYASYYDALMRLPKRRQWPTALAMIRYALEGEEPREDSLYSPAAFMLMRPNIDSGRSKAQQKLREKRDREGEAPAEAAPPPEKKNKNKKEYKYEYEKEREEEKEKETENAAGGALGGAQAPRETDLSLCLSETEKEMLSGFSGETETEPGEESGLGLKDVETREPFAAMLREDGALRSLWDAYLLRGSDGLGPPSEAEKLVVLSGLAAIPSIHRASNLRARLARAQG